MEVDEKEFLHKINKQITFFVWAKDQEIKKSKNFSEKEKDEFHAYIENLIYQNITNPLQMINKKLSFLIHAKNFEVQKSIYGDFNEDEKNGFKQYVKNLAIQKIIDPLTREARLRGTK